MKIFSWNCRGMGNAHTQRIFFSFCQQFSPDYICLIEPMVTFSFISYVFWDRLDLILIAHNNLPFPSIWVLGKRGLPLPSSIHIHYQHIKCHVL